MIQDFHLAKRYFDQAALVDSKAKIPRDIALVLLEVSMSQSSVADSLCHFDYSAFYPAYTLLKL